VGAWSKATEAERTEPIALPERRDDRWGRLPDRQSQALNDEDVTLGAGKTWSIGKFPTLYKPVSVIFPIRKAQRPAQGRALC